MIHYSGIFVPQSKYLNVRPKNELLVKNCC